MSPCGTVLVENVMVSANTLELREEWKGLSFTELLFLMAREHVQTRGADLAWLTDGHTGKQILLSQMEPSARRLGRVFQFKGLQPGDVVTMVDRSRVETPVVALAVWLCGAVFNTMDPNPNQATLEGNLSAFLPKILLTSSDYLNKMEKFCVDNDIVTWLYDEKDSIANLVPYKEDYAKGDDQPDGLTNSINPRVMPFPTSVDPNDLALVLWSSGSTGRPKGIKLPFSALVGTCLRQREAPISTIIDPEFKFLVCTRMFHFSGFIISLCAAADPGPYSVVFLQNDLVSMNLLEQSIITHKPKGLLISYHHTIRMSDQQFRWKEMKHLKVIIPAGARVGEVIEAQLKEKLPWVVLSNVYGSIETGGSVAGSLSQGNVGLLYPNTRVKIEDLQTGEICGPNVVGQICVKNDKMLIGYINADNDGIFDDEGFFRMGDVGYFDEAGILYYCDRLKDLIRVGDHDVYPVTAEDVLDSHPDVLQSGVFGLEDNVLGEVCVALVAPSSDAELSCEEVRRWANNQLEVWSQIKEVREVCNIPVNNIGKKVRKEFKKVWMMNDKWRKTFPVFLSQQNQFWSEGSSCGS
eukprot:GFUD01011002.1.p1 GENE.GFUD01011002.1~~GFUD01011002.1.p1  ORF type:complete len:579 (-),score=172.88 GFUD01011002.1:65-1801(-)